MMFRIKNLGFFGSTVAGLLMALCSGASARAPHESFFYDAKGKLTLKPGNASVDLISADGEIISFTKSLGQVRMTLDRDQQLLRFTFSNKKTVEITKSYIDLREPFTLTASEAHQKYDIQYNPGSKPGGGVACEFFCDPWGGRRGYTRSVRPHFNLRDPVTHALVATLDSFGNTLCVCGE